jgi:methyl-accepting chemotaxis protein
MFVPKTLVAKITTGFVLVLLLMVGSTYVAIDNQNQIDRHFESLVGNALPLLDIAHKMQIDIQNSNRSVSQHATSADFSQLEDLKKAFQQARQNYKQSLNTFVNSTGESVTLSKLARQADRSAQRSFKIGEEYLATHNRILQLSAAFTSRYQETNNEWSNMDSDIRLVEMKIDGLKRVSNPNIVNIESESLTSIERLRLIWSLTSSIAGVIDIDELSERRDSVIQIASSFEGNVNKLKTISSYISRKMKPYVESSKGLTGTSEALFDIFIQLKTTEVTAAEQLTSLSSSVDETLRLQEQLISEITALSTKTIEDVRVVNSSATFKQVGVLIASLLLGIGIVYVVINSLRKPLAAITQVLEQVARGDLTRKVKLKYNDELGVIGDGLNSMIDNLREIIQDISSNVVFIDELTGRVSTTTRASLEVLKEQKNKSVSINHAAQNLSGLTQQISDSASSTLGEVNSVNEATLESRKNVALTLNEIGELEHGLNSASSVIRQLKAESDDISRILTVIQGIAEQTNLLALNAAIEAARAGEQGRGFAVVADEVRNLANKTHDSTGEIYSMIESFQRQSNEAEQTMQQNMAKIESVVGNSNLMETSVQQILDSLDSITRMSETIDAQTSEQMNNVSSVVSTITAVKEISDEVFDNAARNSQSFSQLSELVQKQSESVSTFITVSVEST